MAYLRQIAFAIIIFSAVSALFSPARAQAGYDDDRVMLQGFYWESSRHGYPQKFPQFGSDHWYTIVNREAATIRAGHFDIGLAAAAFVRRWLQRRV